MNCQQAEQLILDAFEMPFSAAERTSVGEHCSHCSACAQFMAVQSEVNQRLQQCITAPALSTNFRDFLMARVHRRTRSNRPAWSPDVAYGIGAIVALIASSIVLPFKPGTVLALGIPMGIATYLLQSFIFVFVNEPCD